jgi:hypothetical protein
MQSNWSLLGQQLLCALIYCVLESQIGLMIGLVGTRSAQCIYEIAASKNA